MANVCQNRQAQTCDAPCRLPPPRRPLRDRGGDSGTLPSRIPTCDRQRRPPLSTRLRVAPRPRMVCAIAVVRRRGTRFRGTHTLRPGICRQSVRAISGTCAMRRGAGAMGHSFGFSCCDFMRSFSLSFYFLSFSVFPVRPNICENIRASLADLVGIV